MTTPSVVLVHGLAGTAATVEPVAAILRSHGVIVTCRTLPGHGTHPDDLRDVTWRHWLDAVIDTVTTADTGSGVVLVGQSLGGALALAAAADATARACVRGVVTVNTPAPDPDALDGLEWRRARGHTEVATVLTEGEEGYATVPIDALVEMTTGVLRIAYDEVRVPTTLVNGALDEFVDPATSTAIAAALTGVPAPGPRLVRLAASGHVATLGPDGASLAAEAMRLTVGSPS